MEAILFCQISKLSSYTPTHPISSFASFSEYPFDITLIPEKFLADPYFKGLYVK